jgi:hypothetical protein
MNGSVDDVRMSCVVIIITENKMTIINRRDTSQFFNFFSQGRDTNYCLVKVSEMS